MGHLGDGNVAIDVRDSHIETKGAGARAVDAWNDLPSQGDIHVGVRNSTVVTRGGIDDRDEVPAHADGISVANYGEGNVTVVIRDSDIETHGTDSDGVIGWIRGRDSPDEAAEGNVDIDIRGGSITTTGPLAWGIFGFIGEYVTGDLGIHLEGVEIMTQSTEFNDDGDTFSVGAATRHVGTGDSRIVMRGGRITTNGDYSYGLFSMHSNADVKTNEGDIFITVRDGARIATAGASGHGIVAYHHGEHERRSIAIAIEQSSVVTGGTGSQAIRVGSIKDGTAERAAALDADGYRRQTVRVNGRVHGGSGDGAGIWLAGGGRVVIGPHGRVGAKSGAAIVAEGDTVVDGQTVPRKLLVHLIPDGKPVPDLLDGVVRNDGGETILALNEVVLYDSTTGATDLWAPNGARDVTLAQGFRELDFSSPGAFIDRHAPRAAVYEALPGVLLRFDASDVFPEERLRSKGSPTWVRLAGTRGSHEPEHSTVGSGYDFERLATEVGIDVPLSEALIASIGGRLLTGSARVSAPTRGGRVDARGHGLALGLAWKGESGWFADGRFSATSYELDVSSDSRGTLERGADASARSFHLGAGRSLALNERTTLTPKTWLSRFEVSIDGFADAVDARFSPADAARLTGGAAGTVESDISWNGGPETLTLSASLGAERRLSGGRTAVLVSGEELKSSFPGTRVLMGLGATLRWGRYSLDGAFRAQGVGASDYELSGHLALRMAF